MESCRGSLIPIPIVRSHRIVNSVPFYFSPVRKVYIYRKSFPNKSQWLVGLVLPWYHIRPFMIQGLHIDVEKYSKRIKWRNNTVLFKNSINQSRRMRRDLSGSGNRVSIECLFFVVTSPLLAAKLVSRWTFESRKAFVLILLVFPPVKSSPKLVQ